MDLVYVTLFSFLSLLVLFLLTKLTGNKQISELTLFDYIIGISIGSIAAEMATDLENFERPLLAMVIYGIVAYLFSLLSMKSITFRRVIFGRCIILMRNGVLYKSNFKKARLDLNEFLMQCRTAGYFDLSALDCVLFEPSGKLSFLPKPNKRPVTAADLKAVPEADYLTASVIIDGEIMEKNLAAFGRSINWLQNEIKLQGYKSQNEIFYGQLDETGTVTFFKADAKKSNNDIYE